MNARREHVARQLSAAVSRLDAVLKPWRLSFVGEGVRSSHCGPFASGYFCRCATRIGISVRDTIDNLAYEHSFVHRGTCAAETERFTIGHRTLMDALGHLDACRLISNDTIPDAVVARHGGDRVEALIHDLSVFASPILRESGDDFLDLIRRGARGRVSF